MTGGGTGGPGRPGGLRGAMGEDFGTNPFAASYEQRIAEAKAELEAVQAGVATAQVDRLGSRSSSNVLSGRPVSTTAIRTAGSAMHTTWLTKTTVTR